MHDFPTYPAAPLPVLDPQLKARLAAGGMLRDLMDYPPVEGRAEFERRAAADPKLSEPVASAVDRTVPGPAGEIPVRVYAPHGNGPFPVLLFYHGGGWVLGSINTHDEVPRSICHRAGVIVVSVDYRLAPEHRFPAPLDDCYAALVWAAEHAAEIGGDPRRLAVGGDSAGGNLAAAVAIRARDERGPRVLLQVLIYPVTNYNFDSASYHQMSTGFGLTRAGMQAFWRDYLRDPAEGLHPLASPLQAGNLAGLPPALVITAHFDVLRDEGEAYAARLAQAGVPVTCTRYTAMNHGFLRQAASYEDGRQAHEQIAAALREALG
ncbi:MAG: alpha/beta hydrolase [Pirellulaceae bacterium]|nr:alpha/beta hydrolase [Pirellulaceae bacterium]